MTDHRPHTHYTAVPYTYAFPDQSPAANKDALADVDASVKNGSRRDVAVISHYHIVLHQGPRINDAILPYLCSGVDQCKVHNDRSIANTRPR